MWTRSTAIVANMDDHNQPGEHWIALFLDKHGTNTYFDSYGIPPLDLFFFRLRRNSIHWNSSIDGTSGNYKEISLKHADNTTVYFYNICICCRYDFNQFLYLFTEDCEYSDRLIVQLFFMEKKYVKHRATCYHVPSKHSYTYNYP